MTEGTTATPATPEGMTPEWITEALRSRGFITRSRVTSVQTERLGSGQGFTGILARVSLRYEGAEREAPERLIAKFPSQDNATLRLAETFQLYEREARFYEQLAGRAGIPAPIPFYVSPGSTARGFILLLEDLWPAKEGDLRAGCRLEQAASLVERLAVFHAQWWDSPELETLPWLRLPNDPGTIEFSDAIARRAWKAFLRKVGRELPAPLLRLGERLTRDTSVLNRLGARPRTLVHGDTRINNWIFHEATGELVALIDWQIVTRARGPLDVASFFVNNLQPDDRRVAEREILPAYHRTLVANGVRGYSFDECWADYRLAVINQFSQVVALSTLLDVTEHMDDEMAAVTGARMFSALTELDLAELLAPESPLERVSAALKRLGARFP